MDIITKFYEEPYLVNMSLRLARMKKPEGIHYFLTATDEEAIIRQVEYDKYLGLAFKHEIMNDELRNRLMSNV